jgi:hypothetical protein
MGPVEPGRVRRLGAGLRGPGLDDPVGVTRPRAGPPRRRPRVRGLPARPARGRRRPIARELGRVRDRDRAGPIGRGSVVARRDRRAVADRGGTPRGARARRRRGGAGRAPERRARRGAGSHRGRARRHGRRRATRRREPGGRARAHRAHASTASAASHASTAPAASHASPAPAGSHRSRRASLSLGQRRSQQQGTQEEARREPECLLRVHGESLGFREALLASGAPPGRSCREDSNPRVPRRPGQEPPETLPPVLSWCGDTLPPSGGHGVFRPKCRLAGAARPLCRPRLSDPSTDTRQLMGPSVDRVADPPAAGGIAFALRGRRLTDPRPPRATPRPGGNSNQGDRHAEAACL